MKKKLTELPTKKLIEKLFPKRVVRQVEKETESPGEKQPPEPPLAMEGNDSSRHKP